MAKGIHASWMHGGAAVCESPGVPALRQAFGTTFTLSQGANVWIHVPVPSPVLFPEGRAALDKVAVCFNAPAAEVELSVVHVFDGTKRLAEIHLERTGDFTNQFVPQNPGEFSLGNVHRFAPRPPVFFGLSLSLNVTSAVANGRFFVSSVGADFVV